VSDQPPALPLGDLSPDDFRAAGHQLVEWIARYLETDHHPVLSQNTPGDIVRALPTQAPTRPESFDQVMADFERVLVPGLTHWNTPDFYAYFSISATGPGVLADFLSSALNQQAMLWRTSPAATELEEVTLNWLRDLMGLPDTFEGVIYDTASISTLHALAAAREMKVPQVRTQGLSGRADVPRVRVYCSKETHSSIDKAAILLGLGHDAVRHIDVDADFRMKPDALEAAIEEDLRAGLLPIAVVPTVGTTSTTSIDPVDRIADIAEKYDLWLHVDGAYAGVLSIVPELSWISVAWPRAHSIVVNPHKSLFIPFDLSVLYCRRMDLLRSAFTLIPDYLQTTDASHVRNLMDTGVQLGRRFRALKLWMVFRMFGVDGLRARLVEPLRLARLFASWVDAHPRFERVAPVPLGVVCFRALPLNPDNLPTDTFNERLLERLNASGRLFLSQTRLEGRYVLRLAIGHVRTTEAHILRAWELMQSEVLTLDGHLSA